MKKNLPPTSLGTRSTAASWRGFHRAPAALSLWGSPRGHGHREGRGEGGGAADVAGGGGNTSGTGGTNPTAPPAEAGSQAIDS